MDKFKCPFCGHNKPYRTTPFIDRISGKMTKQPCCKRQASNMDYQDKRFVEEDKPNLEDVSKL